MITERKYISKLSTEDALMLVLAPRPDQRMAEGHALSSLRKKKDSLSFQLTAYSLFQLIIISFQLISLF